ncbi:MAG: hypothetical protein AABZ53_04280 [Planctomycetota bacterium]
MPATNTTSINRSWMLKMAAIGIIFAVFGIWGYYDASIVYPARGVASAEYLKYLYLDEAKRQSLLLSPLSVKDPAGELDRLRKTAAEQLKPLDLARREWLDSLAIINTLDAAHTEIPSAELEHTELHKKFTTATGAPNIPKPLSWWDIPVQWLICGLGLAVGLWMLALIIVVSRSKYSWDPEAKVLTLPDGSTLAIAECEDFDRRKWDKFLMFVRVRTGHPRHAGKEIRLDLLRYVPLEDWVVEMEYAAFPDRAKAAESSAEPEPPVETPANPA